MSRFHDYIQLAKRMTVRRVVNMALLRTSFYYSKWKKKTHVWGLPMSISLEPTTSCNLACPECPSGLKLFTRPTGRLKPDKNEMILDQLKKTVFFINYYFQGEPFLNPDFLKLVKAAHDRNIYTSTSTNCHFISSPKIAENVVQSGLDRLIISIDGASQETYEGYRKKGQLSKVLEGSRLMVEAKRKLKSKTPHLIFQFLVVKPNEHDIPKIYEMAEEMGIDEVRLKTAQVYKYKNGNPLIPDNDKYSRYKKMPDGTYRIKNKMKNECWRMWSSCVFTWDLKVVPCCFDKDARHVLGNAEEDGGDFKKLWHHKTYNGFRQAILTDRKQIDICRNCVEGTKVWA